MFCTSSTRITARWFEFGAGPVISGEISAALCASEIVLSEYTECSNWPSLQRPIWCTFQFVSWHCIYFAGGIHRSCTQIGQVYQTRREATITNYVGTCGHCVLYGWKREVLWAEDFLTTTLKKIGFCDITIKCFSCDTPGLNIPTEQCDFQSAHFVIATKKIDCLKQRIQNYVEWVMPPSVAGKLNVRLRA